jgi:hypothetical protein
MKNILFMLLLLLGSSCIRHKMYKTYPNCVEYFEFIEQSWSRKDNGFFMITEVPDSTKPEWFKYVEPPQFQQQWDKYKDECLCQLTEKEVKHIFGEPTKKGKTYRAIDKITTTSYGYYIADESCNEEAQQNSELVICSSMGFTFWKGKQGRKYLPKPRLTLRNYNR